jgi:hypothetical protein
VEMDYRPVSFWVGLLVSLATLLAMLSLFVRRRFKPAGL